FKKMYKKACNYFLNEGFSCSESVIKAAADEGFIPVDFVKIGTAFSGGMGSGCLCGAVAGAQIVISYCKNEKARILAKKFIEEFKKKTGAACCRVLTSKFGDFHSKERKMHCVNMVELSSRLLEEILKTETIGVK
ncbi:MAG: C-GCAxxG-C-C family protein, partial [Candidatus Gastranaerophilales bacterium]|nr:C-GCAxxG-C-C family protein [Candidatus Gastranaerophilales bacterium]